VPPVITPAAPRRTGRARSPYLQILRLPGALGFSAAGFVARMPMSMFGLGTVLLVAAVTGRYGVAGLVAAAGSVAYAGCAPLIAKLADRFGQQRVLRPQAAVFGTACAVFIAAAKLGAPVWALLPAAALAGATMPSLGSMVRARWSVLLSGSARLHTAFSLESVADEVIFVIGPAVVTLLATDVDPAAGVATAALLCVTGTLLFAAQRRTQPLPGRAAPPGPVPAGPGAGPGQRRGGPRVPARGLLTLVPVYLFLGAMFVSIDVTTVAFAAARGHKALAGLWLGLYALSSAVGGLWYGSRRWRAPLARRFAITLGCTAAGVSTFWLVPGLAVLAAVMLATGLAIAPTLIAGYGLIEQQAPVHRRTEGMTWLSSAVSVGVAAGSPVAGHLIDAYGPRWGYVFALTCATAAVLTCVAGLGRLRDAPAGPAVVAEPQPGHCPA
jgi:MFS family permease